MPMHYNVGYSKPPKHSQFKKGKSGNPKGKILTKNPELSVKNILEQELKSKITVTENGQKKTITKLQAVLKTLTSKGLSGDRVLLRYLCELIIRFTPIIRDEKGTTWYEWTQASEDTVDKFLATVDIASTGKSNND